MPVDLLKIGFPQTFNLKKKKQKTKTVSAKHDKMNKSHCMYVCSMLDGMVTVMKKKKKKE